MPHEAVLPWYFPSVSLLPFHSQSFCTPFVRHNFHDCPVIDSFPILVCVSIDCDLGPSSLCPLPSSLGLQKASLSGLRVNAAKQLRAWWVSKIRLHLLALIFSKELKWMTCHTSTACQQRTVRCCYRSLQQVTRWYGTRSLDTLSSLLGVPVYIAR